MSTMLVSIDEYLDTAYSPDREFVDGIVLERNLGEFEHSQTQSNLIALLRAACPKLFVLPEQRVRTTATRSRIPDVCVAAARPRSGVLETPPLICIEILSRGDAVVDVLAKLQEYVDLGVPAIWLLDPWSRKAYAFRNGLTEIAALRLETSEVRVQLSLNQIFDRI